MKSDTIKGIAIAILIIGGIAGIIYGFVNQTISAEYLSNMAKYPLTYTADKAEYVFNWVGALCVWLSSFITYLFIYIGGAIVENMEYIQYQLAKLTDK